DAGATSTAARSTGTIETLTMQRVSGRRLAQPALPDLVPVNPRPPDPSGFCRVDGHGRLTVTVRNQGTADAGASLPTVNFAGVGPVSVNTPPIAAGASVDVFVSIPSACYIGTTSRFQISVDFALQVGEYN